RAATTWLEERLAPEVDLHGDVVELYGLGVLILGKSGIGKSEAALDLVSRGHRLVADDVVHVRRISPMVLRGRAAQLLEHHMEIRGLGIIDVAALFGTLATLDERQIDLVVELIEWPDAADRLGLVEGTYALLEVDLPLVRVPVRPGRSVAMLVETAARNHLLRLRGRHSALAFAEHIDREIATRGKRRAGEPA
ncbi:MAG TPA: HPr(Ser) kinase/phosphatase, partial [Candidatus Binatus sp.]|nr:HPr(Ser) kinase/phosphatase [Candidatus Binatus sp.]